MAYESLADMIEAHKKTVIKQLAEAINARSIPSYATMPTSQLSALVEPMVEMVAQYFRVGDPNNFRDYSVQLTEAEISIGHESKAIIAVIDSMFDIMRNLTDSELSMAENAADRTKYLRRIEGARVLVEVTVNATALRKKKQQQ